MIKKFLKYIDLFLQSNYKLSVFNKIYSILMGIISSAFYFRYLGLEYKGIYSYINAVATIIVLIINFGIYQSYPYYFKKKGHEIYERYVNIFLFQFVIYLVVATISIVFLKNNITMVFILAQIPFLVLKTQVDNIMVVENIRLYMWIDMGLKSVLLVLYFLLWRFAPVQIGYLVAIIAITNFIVSVIYIRATDYKLSLKKIIPDISFIKTVVKFGFFPMLSSLLMTLNYGVDIIFLRNMGNEIELSLYSVAAVIINYVWVVPNAFKEVLISHVARDESEEQVVFAVKISLFITFIFFMMFAMLGRFAIKVIFGAEFQDCYLVTLILFVGAFSMIFFKMLGVIFVSEGRQRPYFIILFVSVIVNLIFNYILIPMWGMYGAAVASVVSYTVCGFAFLKSYCQLKNHSMSKYFFISSKDVKMFLKI